MSTTDQSDPLATPASFADVSPRMAGENVGQTPGPQQRATGHRRCTGAFRCYPGSSKSRIQGLLGVHYPRLWEQVTLKWLPTARPIEPGHIQTNGDYSRATLADVLLGLGESAREWDGFDVCDVLKHFYGWQCDFHLAALIHAWSRDLRDRLRS